MIFNRNKLKIKSESLFDNLDLAPHPWRKSVVISAAGIIASGWTSNSKIFLLSSDGYSVSDQLTGEIEIRNYDEDNTAMDKLSSDNLEFRIDEINQTIKVFGLRGGNGNHVTSDFWSLDSFHPGLENQIIGIRNLKERNKDIKYWRNYTLLKLERLEYDTLKYGFSNDEKYFGIFGSGGAEIFCRE